MVGGKKEAVGLLGDGRGAAKEKEREKEAKKRRITGLSIVNPTGFTRD